MAENKKKLKILIVEDDARLGKTLSDVLEAKGYSPVTVLTGKEGVAAIKEEDISLALLDLKLPDISGIEVLKEIKKNSPRTEVIILTAFASLDTATEAVNLGAFSYLQKPYDMERLLLDIHRALERKWAEESLRTLAETYSDLCERSPIAIVNVYKDYHVDCTDRLLEWTGWSREEMNHINLVKKSRFINAFGNVVVLPPLVAAEMIEKTEKDYIPKLMRGETLDGVYQCYNRKDGGTVPLELNSVGYFGGKEPKPENFVHTICIFSNITERKKAEETLKKSEQRYRRLFEAANDGIYTLDLKGNFTSANRRTEEISGYKKEEFLGKSISCMLTEEELKAQYEKIKQIAAGPRIPPYEIKIITKEGSVKPLELSIHGIEEEGKITGVLGIARDITERKRAEEALKKSEHKFRTLFENIPDIAFVVDNEGRYVEVNEKTKNLLQKPDIIGKRPEELGIPLTIAKMWRKDQEKCRITGQPNINEFDLFGRRVQTVLSLIPKTGNIIGIARDITERKRAEETLKKEKNFSANVITTVPDSLLVLDANLRIKSANRSFYEKFQTEPEEVIGSGITEILGDENGKLSAALTQLFGTGDMLENFELHCQSEKLGERIFNITARGMLIAEEEEEEEELVVLEDITERKKAGDKLQESEEKYRNLFENAGDLIMTVDLDGKFTLVNKAAENVAGCDRREIIGKHFTEFVPSKYHPLLLEAFEKEAKGIPTPLMEIEIKAKNGELIPIEIFQGSIPIKEKGQLIGLQITAIDVRERKEAEQALRKSEAKYMDLYENANDIIFTFDLQGRFTSANRAACIALGYRKDEISKQTFSDVLLPEDAKLAWERLQKVVASKSDLIEEQPWEYKAVRKDSSILDIEVRTRLILENGKIAGVQGIARDITERKRAEEELKNAEEQYRVTFEHTGTAMAILEEDTTISLCNKEFEELSGYSKAEIEGKKSWTAFAHSDDLERMRRYHEERRKEGGKTPTSYDFKFIDRKGNIKDIYLAIEIIPGTKKSVASLIDVTERKQAEKEVNKSRKFLATIIDNIPDAVTIKDRQYRLVLVNQAFCNITGHTKEEVIGKTVYWKADKEVFQTGKGLDIPEQTHTDLKGKRRYASVKKAPLTDESGEVSHVVSISRDITKRKAMEDAMLAAYKELETLDKLKTDFLNVAYHEMRSPLTPIVGYTSLLEQSQLSEKQKNYLSIINDSAFQLDKLINRLLEVTRIEAGKVKLSLEEVSIAEIVNNRIERVKPQVDAKKQKIYTVVPEGTEVEGDKEKITAIFDNLILNAVKHTGENSRIDIVVEDRKKEEKIRVCVADTGAGISEEQLPKVFERFYMVDTSLTRKGGLGLGLAIVKGYVKLHGGEVWVTSELGKGSKFWFTLPKKQR